MRTKILALVVLLLLFCVTDAGASEPGWHGRPILFGAQRAHMKSLRLLDRPYRPFHFYGNTVRRRHFRGRGLPMPRDFVLGAVSLVRRY
jgi:hypothetical protein